MKFVQVFAAAFRAGFQIRGGVLVATIQTTVTVMVYGTVSDIVFIHHIHDTHDRFGVMGSVAIHLYVKDMAATSQIMIRSFHFGFMTGAALVIYRDVIRVRIIIPIRDTGERSELLTIFSRELAGQAFCRSCQYAIIVLVLLRELVGAIPDIRNDPYA